MHGDMHIKFFAVKKKGTDLMIKTNIQCNSRGGYRYDSLDTFKFIACFMVVLLHFPVNNILGDYLAAVARIGVPFFFLVSGFFSYTEEYNVKKGIRKIYKYFILIIGINAVYLVKDILRMMVHKIELQDLTARIFSPEFLIANFGVAGHIWFIRALLYIAVFELIFHKVIDFKKVKCVLPFVWLSDIIIIKYAFVLGIFIPQPYNEILSKFIGVAFFYYYIGRYIKEHLSFFIEHKLKHCTWIAILIMFVLFLLSEKFMLDNYLENLMPANYIMIMPCTIFIFIVLLQNPLWGHDRIFDFIGRELSMYIYYWHPLIGIVLAGVMHKISFFKGLHVNVLLVFVGSIICGYLIYTIKYLIYKKRLAKV